MRNAEHLARALTLEMGKEVTWTPNVEADVATFKCGPHTAMVSRRDLFNLPTMDTQTRAGLYKRVRRALEGAS